MNIKTKNILQVNGAVLLWGGTILFAKIITLPVYHIILGRSLVAALALFLFILITKDSFKIAGRKDLGVIIFLGILLSVHWVLYFYSVQISTVAIGIISLHTHPVITILLEPFFFKEKHTARDLLLAVIVFGGVILLVDTLDLNSVNTMGVIWGVVSAFLFSIRNIISRKYIQQYSGASLMFYQNVTSTLLLLPLLFLIPVEMSLNHIGLLTLLGIFFTALPHTLFINGMESLKAKTVSIIAVLLPLHGVLMAALILGEIPSWRTALGGIIIVAATIIETVMSLKKE